MSVASSSASSAASTIKCPMPVEPGSRGEPIKVQSNLFGIIMDQQVRTLYRYDVTIYGTGREVEDFDDPTVSPIFFTKKTASDAISTERKARAGAALFLALEEIPTIIKESLFYDYQSILFSTEKLEPMPIKKLLKVDDSTSGGAFKGFKLIAVEVKKCSAVSEITTDAYRHLDNSVAAINRDRSVLQFLEIAMNQHPLLHPHEFLVFEKGKIYLKKPGDFGVNETELKRLPDGKELKVGSQKNIMYVEGPSGRNKINIGLAFDAKKAAFHISGQKCSEKAMEILRNFDFGRTCTSEQLFQLECVFKGLLVEAMHTKRRYKIQRVTADATKTITFDGVDMTIADYFMKKHNIRLQAPYAPLFVMQTKKEVMMPLEMCMVVDDQRVGILQQTPVQMRETTRECAVNPLRRQTMIMTNFRALGLNQEKLPSDPGFKLLANPMMVDGRRLPCPQLMYARSAAAIVDPQRFSWRHPRGIPFLHPGKIKCWAIYGVSNRRASFDLKRLADRIQQEASGRGITIPPVGDVDWVSPQRLQEGLFPYLISHNVDYVMFAMDEELSLQDDIKYLERKHSIVTQNMKLRTAREIVEKGKGATVENLCNKMNLKLGGINFTIKMNGERFLHDNRTLVIGIGTNTPPPGAVLEGNGGKKKGDMPSIVGFAANVGEHVETFCGDFDFVEARNEDAQLVGSIVVKHAVEAWMKYDRPIPDRIVIYRAGLASGSFDKLLQVEIPAIRARLAELKCPSRLTYIIAAKDHSIRLFLPQINQNARGPEQNVMSGTVVDSQLTNPKLKQFYLNSHVTLQGSAATPLYTILYDENDFTMDSIEKFTYDLCFLHEIVNLPTSIPTPLYVANRYADRGRRLVAYDVAHDTNSSSSFSVDSDKVRERVQYKFSPFSDRRINA